MIVKEELTIDNVEFIRTYSDKRFYIRGGEPYGLYAEAIDLAELGREYEETDIPIEDEETPTEDEATAEDYQSALEELGVNFNEEG